MEPTLTPTPLPTTSPYLHEVILSDGSYAGVYYQIDAGQAVIMILWLVILGMIALRIFMELRRARN